MLPVYFYEIPVKATMEMPSYEPKSKCDFTSKDITYSLVVDSGIAAWFTFDDNTRIVTIDTKARDTDHS